MELTQKAAQIKLIVFDVDGVFTNGHIFMDDHGDEHKAFHVLDGQGVKWLLEVGIHVAIISGRDAKGVALRMQQLGIQHVFQGVKDKIPVYEKLITTLNIKDHEVAYMGDDLPDLPVLRRVGLGIAVANAVAEVKQYAQWTTKNAGGQGAIREVCEFLLKTQHHWDKLLTRYHAC